MKKSKGVEYNLKHRYNISVDDYNKMLEEQNHCCKICGEHSSNNTKNKLYVDHSHKTGKVRGLLCNKCNTALGLLGDSIDVLSNSTSYLKQYD